MEREDQISCPGLIRRLLPKPERQGLTGTLMLSFKHRNGLVFFLSGELLPIMINEHGQRK